MKYIINIFWMTIVTIALINLVSRVYILEDYQNYHGHTHSITQEHEDVAYIKPISLWK